MSAVDPKPTWPRFSVCIASTPTPPSWAPMLGLPIGSPRAGGLHASTTRAQRDGGGLEVAVLPYHAILAGRLLRHGSKMPPTALPPSFLNRRPEPPRNGLRRHRIGHDGNRAAVARERPGCVVQHLIAAGHSGAIGRHDAHTGVQCKGLATVATGAIWGAVDHTRGRRGESDDQGRLHEPNVWVRKSHRLAFRQGHRLILQQLQDAREGTRVPPSRHSPEMRV